MYSPTILEAGSPQSSHQHNHTPSEGSRGEPFLVLHLLAAPDPPWLVAVELQTLPPLLFSLVSYDTLHWI